METYSAFADFYDRLTDNVPYSAFADHYERLFAKFGRRPSSILDLACGTGSLSKILAERGYEIVGVDRSEEMLSYALEKTDGMENQPVFIAQSIQKLDLYGTSDACICSLDSINYVTSQRALQSGFVRLHNFIEPGGLFIFDVNSEARFTGRSGECFTREEDDFYCVWQARYSAKSRLCRYYIDIFAGPDGDDRYSLIREVHSERFYDRPELEAMLKQAGFKLRGVFGGFTLRRPTEKDERIFYVAERI